MEITASATNWNTRESPNACCYPLATWLICIVSSLVKIILIPRLHDTIGCETGCTTGCQTGLTTVLNEQPLFVQVVVKPVVQPVWLPAVSCKQTSNRFVYTIQPVVNLVWQPCWMNSHCLFSRLSNRVVQPVWQPAVSTIQPIVKPVVTQVWLYRVYKHLTGCQTGLTTGCIM